MRSKDWFLTGLSRCPKGALKLEVMDGIHEVRLGAYRTVDIQNNEPNRQEPPWYGTVCPVVREDGGREPPSYPIC